ncbi:MAG: rhomboid family intramembrane serine protease [Tannerellaceae bacterium]|jgi:membrane associated rhomboid family serine protease|nr:rhomboid family intramembrane serine protease [Tannerellaceae bacterium]
MPQITNIFNNLKLSFHRGSVLAKLIYLNAAVFVVLRLCDVAFMLFNAKGIGLAGYISMPSGLGMLLHRPWTLITYMFTHYDFLHIIFNMLWLYWFGAVFLQFFRPRQLCGLYLLGGVGGGVMFAAAYNTFPYFSALAEGSMLMGASASVMAIVFASAFYRKDYQVMLLFFGRIKLIYLALIVFVFDLIAITSANAGGHIAHIGGALTGIWFASMIRNGKDITSPLNRFIDIIANATKPKPRMRVTYRRGETNQQYNGRKNTSEAEIDAILDKLKRSGYAGLSPEEKRRLFDASKR